MPEVSIIIPQFGRSELTIECVNSLLRWHSNEELEVIVVDDGSGSTERRRLQRELASAAILLSTGRRQGVTAAWQLGAEWATGQTLVFLNNDCVTTGVWVPQLIAPLVQEVALAAGPQGRRAREMTGSIGWNCPHEQLLAGWCLALQRCVLQRLGGFDCGFRLYFSDTDLQLRLLQSGMDETARCLKVVEGLPLKHLKHATTRQLPSRRKEWLADRLRFRRKWLLEEGPRHASDSGL